MAQLKPIRAVVAAERMGTNQKGSSMGFRRRTWMRRGPQAPPVYHYIGAEPRSRRMAGNLSATSATSTRTDTFTSQIDWPT